jgi:hypothetical protein
MDRGPEFIGSQSFTQHLKTEFIGGCIQFGSTGRTAIHEQQAQQAYKSMF